MGKHGYRHARDSQMLGLDFDTSDVLRRIMALAADDVTQLRVHREGRGLDCKMCYAYMPLRCRVNNDRVSTQVKNCAAFADVKQHESTLRGTQGWLQPCQPVRD